MSALQTISLDFISILEIGGIFLIALWVVGIFSLYMGSYAARRDFREKGYVRPPSGKQWFPFLFEKRYEAFNNGSIRFFFGISHFCLIALIVVAAALLLLIGANALFNSMSGP